MEKICTTEHPCPHRTLGTTCYGCNYVGYCDFQLPRDSRMQPLLPVDNLFKRCICIPGELSDPNCPVHGVNKI